MFPAPWPSWAVCHLPADSAAIPVELRSWLRLSEPELSEQLALRTSHRSGDLFARNLPEQQVVRALCSPLVLDVTAPPEAYGMGAPNRNPAATLDGNALDVLSACKPLTQAELEVLVDEYYHPHQAWFAARVALKVAAHGRCLVVNALSFPATEAAFDVDESLARLPDIRLGAHPAHTSRRLLETFEAAFLGHAWRVRVAPGHPAAMVPRLQEGQDRRVQCLSVEVNRGLYWDSAAGRPLSHYEDFRDRLAAALGAAFSRLD